MFWKRGRICYYKLADDFFFKMFPQLYIRKNRESPETSTQETSMASTQKSRTKALVIDMGSNAIRFDLFVLFIYYFISIQS
jgi:hypothetical protein